MSSFHPRRHVVSLCEQLSLKHNVEHFKMDATGYCNFQFNEMSFHLVHLDDSDEVNLVATLCNINQLPSPNRSNICETLLKTGLMLFANKSICLSLSDKADVVLQMLGRVDDFHDAELLEKYITDFIHESQSIREWLITSTDWN